MIFFRRHRVTCELLALLDLAFGLMGAAAILITRLVMGAPVINQDPEEPWEAA